MEYILTGVQVSVMVLCIGCLLRLGWDIGAYLSETISEVRMEVVGFFKYKRWRK